MREQVQETTWQRLGGRLRGVLLDDLQLKLLALLIVGVIWFSVAGQSRHSTPITIPNIDVVLDNPPGNLAVTSSTPTQVKIKVQGPEDILREMRIAASTRSSDLYARADLSTFREGGVQIAPLQIVGLPDGVVLREIDEPAVRVTLDTLENESVKVEPRIVGTVPEGYKLTGVTVTPEYVTIRGPRSVLDSIDEIQTTTVSLNGRTESFERPVEIDITGSDVTVLDNVVVGVRIEEDYGTKEFTVPVTTSGGGVIEPASVTVVLRGPYPALNQITAADISAVVQPAGEGPRQSIAPQIQVSGPAAPRVEVESVSPQTVRWRR